MALPDVKPVAKAGPVPKHVRQELVPIGERAVRELANVGPAPGRGDFEVDRPSTGLGPTMVAGQSLQSVEKLVSVVGIGQLRRCGRPESVLLADRQ
ncbi:hypothetical protein chiPu_0016929 [Chiloscyllium punctatum]|uniref:Uncharacterized protein n=1 Tax=Chiloscyllium punctatum TaxID=137246 RepID=A0A401T713_CHIPU|nr:hypothetical protein [Chiloscyllium punctatum]